MATLSSGAAAGRRGLSRRLHGLWRDLSTPGLLLGALFLAASLTPSLIPRAAALQGVLAGVCFAVGYGLGKLASDLWAWLGLGTGSERVRRRTTWGALAVTLAVVAAYSWRATEWQNSVRRPLGMEPVTDVNGLVVLGVALVVFAALVLLATGVIRLYTLSERQAERVMPLRLARLVAVVVAGLLVLFILNGVLLRLAFRAADSAFGRLDALIQPESAPPADPLASGSAASLLDWTTLGRTGRDFVATGPTAAEISALSGRPARQPLRVYVGLNAAPTVQERADLALAELIRVGAFSRRVLVIATPTGTGWMDPAGLDPIEYLQDGDIATVGLQYSYFSSPLSLLFQPGVAPDSARVLFRRIYAHWHALPRESRPKLYLFGLSLGSAGSERSFRLHEVFPDPFDGALWAGPPFSNPLWRSATDDRNPGTPEWLPEFGDSSMIRFTSQQDHAAMPGVPWGPVRVVYLQYASDPITFFSFGSFWHRPDWTRAPRGPDVSEELRWYPVVTALQLALDSAIGLAVPTGFGHDYAPQHYIDAWVAVSAPEGWSAEDVARLKAKLGR